jgi:PhnB protein
MTELYPFLAVRDVARAVEWYAEAFGAVEVGERLEAPDGAVVAEIAIDGCRVGLATEAPGLGTSLMFPVADQPYGLRQGRVVDPFGHHWLIGRPL